MMNRNPLGHPLAGAVYLAGLSFRRLIRSRQTIVSAMLLGFALLVVLAWSMRRERLPEDFVRQILIPIYTTFLLPIFCLCYGAASIAGDRDEQTLAYLLVSPLPRPLIYLAKYLSAAVIVLAWTLGGFALLCRVAGDAGGEALSLYWPVIFWSSLAYVGLFHLFSAVFKRATIVAFAYALFLEAFLGSMPGVVKRLAISFYTECLIFAKGSAFGLGPAGHHDPALFLPVAESTAQLVLCLTAALTFLLGAFLFARREYA